MTKTYRDELGRPNHALTQHEVVRTMRRATELLRMLAGQLHMARVAGAANEIMADSGLYIIELHAQAQSAVDQLEQMQRTARDENFKAMLVMLSEAIPADKMAGLAANLEKLRGANP
jgi:tRNA A37 methylthiotransferase MiaB